MFHEGIFTIDEVIGKWNIKTTSETEWISFQPGRLPAGYTQLGEKQIPDIYQILKPKHFLW
jgi:hypothetical protein